ncbi:hypothetical protein BD289DRAFT_438293 [Coniella lustricola]|uniref:Pentatricopeptide repeat protein n=1 Tax=Coniella lustricola TaxID=2025994 RepID=A0A2T3A318_9PEZI|nr:hypothetical protein BD289DRAFT_438293 [Coniella lustricola]
MSFSLLRVPKKAALTALHGLVVGTSCGLVLITEDRRRRINQARTVLSNSDKIRSAKQYHGSRSSIEDQLGVPSVGLRPTSSLSLHQVVVQNYEAQPEFIWSQDTNHNKLAPPDTADKVERGLLPPPAQPSPRADSYDVSRQGSSAHTEHTESPDQINTASSPAAGPDQTSPFSRVSRFHAVSTTQQLAPSLFDFKVPVRPDSSPVEIPHKFTAYLHGKKPLEVAQLIQEKIELHDAEAAQEGLTALKEILLKSDYAVEEKSALVRAAVSLCCQSQELGEMQLATEALHCLVRLGPLTVADYYASDPQNVIEHALMGVEVDIKQLVAGSAGSRAAAEHTATGAVEIPTNKAAVQSPNVTHKQRQLAARKTLKRAIDLLMPRFEEGELPASRVQEWLPAAEKAMNLALDLDIMIEQAANIFWRIQHYNADLHGVIVQRYMARLQAQGRSKPIVSTFNLVRHRLAQYMPDTWSAIGDIVVAAVEDCPGQDSAKVLRHMVEFCPKQLSQPAKPLRTSWITKLLYCHWQRCRDFDGVLAVFRQFEQVGGFNLAVHVDGVYRVMIQTAVEAEQWSAMDELLRELEVVKPTSAKEARILGLVALAKAKVGDWSGVWAEFEKMEIRDRIEAVFSPILYEYSKSHTTREVEDFLKNYIRNMDLPIGPYIVNMVANRYGDVRDHQSFLDWLLFCTSQGFKIDAAFGQAIIYNCRRRWDFALDDLKTIYHTLRVLSSDFADQVTENEMVSTALRTHMRASQPFIKRQILSVSAKLHRPHLAGNASDMRVNMKQAYATRKYSAVLSLYKSACKQGVFLDDGHLRLAVMACLKPGDQLGIALDLIKEGKARGMNVSSVVTPIFTMQAQKMFSQHHNLPENRDMLLIKAKDLVTSFEERGLDVGHAALMRTAHLLLRARHHEGALSFAYLALEQRGVQQPDDVATFQLFIGAFAYKADVDGLRWTIGSAVHMQYYHKGSVYRALKDARNLLQKHIQSRDVKEALWVLEQGLDKVRIARHQLQQDQRALERTTLEIMKNAALDASDQPTDHETLLKRAEIIRQLEEKDLREREEAERTRVEMRRERELRRRAAEEVMEQNAGAADVMEMILEQGKHEVAGEF